MARASMPAVVTEEQPTYEWREHPPYSWFYQEEFWRSITIGVISGAIVVVGGLIAASWFGLIGSDNAVGTVRDFVAALIIVAFAAGSLYYTWLLIQPQRRWWQRAVYIVGIAVCTGLGLFSYALFADQTARVVDYMFGDSLALLGVLLKDAFG